MNVWPLPRLSFRELSSIQESRPAALITQASEWANIGKLFQLPLLIQAEPNRDENDFFEYLASNLPAQVQVIYAVGDGYVIDAAKIVANRNKKPLVIIPPALSSDDPFTPTANAHNNGKAQIIETGPAEEVVIDLNQIKNAPAEQRAAGIVDVLSIVTGLLDWAYAAQKNKLTSGTKLSSWAVGLAAALASQALKGAPAIGKGDPDALHTLVDLICLTVQLDNQLGHRRASQGVEHIFADAIKADPSVSHAERLAPGILIASALHNKDTASMRAAMQAAGVRVDRIPHADIRATVNSLPDYARSSQAPYTILNDLSSNGDELAQALTKSTLLPAS